MESCIVACSDGAITCELSNILKHSKLVTKLCSERNDTSCVCMTTFYLPSLSVDPTSLAISLLEQTNEGEGVRVKAGWVEVVLPCYSLLGISWTEDTSNNSVGLDPVAGAMQVNNNRVQDP